MAASFKDNVIISSTSGDTLGDRTEVVGIKVVCGGSAGSVQLSAGGTVIYEATLAANTEKHEAVKMRVTESTSITLTGSVKIYIYCA